MRIIKKKLKKRMGYCCPDCGKTYVSTIKNVFSTRNPRIGMGVRTWLQCDCGSDCFEVDINLLSAISELNSMGIKTEFCCEGHSFTDPGYIAFAPHISLEKLDLGCPSLWYVDKDNIYKNYLIELDQDGKQKDISYTCDTIRPIQFEKSYITFEEYKAKYIASLYNWIIKLKFENKGENLI